MTNKKHIRRGLAGLLAVVMLFSLVPAAFAAQENGYHDPAEHWLTASNRTNELDASLWQYRQEKYRTSGTQTVF